MICTEKWWRVVLSSLVKSRSVQFLSLFNLFCILLLNLLYLCFLPFLFWFYLVDNNSVLVLFALLHSLLTFGSFLYSRVKANAPLCMDKWMSPRVLVLVLVLLVWLWQNTFVMLKGRTCCSSLTIFSGLLRSVYFSNSIIVYDSVSAFLYHRSHFHIPVHVTG